MERFASANNRKWRERRKARLSDGIPQSVDGQARNKDFLQWISTRLNSPVSMFAYYDPSLMQWPSFVQRPNVEVPIGHRSVIALEQDRPGAVRSVESRAGSPLAEIAEIPPVQCVSVAPPSPLA